MQISIERLKKLALVLCTVLLVMLTAVAGAAENTRVILYGQGGTSQVELTSATPYYHNGASGQLGIVNAIAEGANISASWDANGTAVLALNGAYLEVSVNNNVPLISLSGSTTVVVPKGDTSTFINKSTFSPVFYLQGGTLRLTGSGSEADDGLLILKSELGADPYETTRSLYSNSIVMTAKTYTEAKKAQPYVVQVESLRLQTSSSYGFGSFSNLSGCNEDMLIENSDIDLYCYYYGINGSRITMKNTKGQIQARGGKYDYGNDALNFTGTGNFELTIEDCDLSINGTRDAAQFIMNGTSASASINIKNSKLDLTGNSYRSGDGALEIWNRKNGGTASVNVTDSEIALHSNSSRPININGINKANVVFDNSAVTLTSSNCSTDGISISASGGADLTLSDTLLDIQMTKGNAGIRLAKGSAAGTLTITGNKSELIGSVKSGHVLNGPNASTPLDPTYQNYYPRVRAAEASSGTPLDFNEINPAVDVYRNTAYRYLHITPAKPTVTYYFEGDPIPDDVPVPDPCETEYLAHFTPEQPKSSRNLLFIGWFTDKEGTVPCPASVVMDKDLVLYGFWKTKPPVTGDSAAPGLYLGLIMLSLLTVAAVCRKKRDKA